MRARRVGLLDESDPPPSNPRPKIKEPRPPDLGPCSRRIFRRRPRPAGGAVRISRAAKGTPRHGYRQDPDFALGARSRAYRSSAAASLAPATVKPTHAASRWTTRGIICAWARRFRCRCAPEPDRTAGNRDQLAALVVSSDGSVGTDASVVPHAREDAQRLLAGQAPAAWAPARRDPTRWGRPHAVGCLTGRV